MKKIGFVIPWYSDKVRGGAETELRGIAKHLASSGVELEILTTCVKESVSPHVKETLPLLIRSI